ncbi:MAG: permease-like cell division protein FtsX [Candidatus Campbellbacteria bacterium]|nr:permease-like cell division protein FtsX [Candidatus Campbellbacteria bacterium]
MSFSTNIKRIIHYGFVNFFRNTFISLSSVFVMATMLFVVGLSLLGNTLFNDALERVREKVDVTVYFVPATEEAVINDFKAFTEGLDGVSDVSYVSQNEALAEYRRKHADDAELLQGLDELEVNPLRARLHVHATDITYYESISESIQNKDLFSDDKETVIDKIDYFEDQNQIVIQRLSNIIDTSDLIMTVIILILVIVALIINYLTVRLTVYSSKDEIAVMGLVGTGRFYSQGPFIIEGLLYGVFGSFIAMIALYFFSLWANTITQNFFGGEGLVSYYSTNSLFVFGILLLIGVIVGCISSIIAVRKYIK